MTIKNFANFGFFTSGKCVNSGSISSMENEAIRMIMSGQAERCHVSVYDVNDKDEVIEVKTVLAIHKIGDSIYIVNMLIKGEEI